MTTNANESEKAESLNTCIVSNIAGTRWGKLMKEITPVSFAVGIFPNELKFAEVSLISENNDSLVQEDYRLATILPHTSFHMLMYNQINE